MVKLLLQHQTHILPPSFTLSSWVDFSSLSTELGSLRKSSIGIIM